MGIQREKVVRYCLKDIWLHVDFVGFHSTGRPVNRMTALAKTIAKTVLECWGSLGIELEMRITKQPLSNFLRGLPDVHDEHA